MTHSPLEVSPLFHIGPVPISDLVIVTWGIMALLFLFALTVTRRLSLTPGKRQTTLEILVGAIDGQIRETIGLFVAGAQCMADREARKTGGQHPGFGVERHEILMFHSKLAEHLVHQQ